MAIVTGASRGIGSSIAIALAKAGASVIVNYVRQADAAATVVSECKKTGSNAAAVQADITNETDVKRLVLMATQFGIPKILVNNAGIAKTKLLLDTSFRDWNEVIALNLTAPFLCTKEVLPYMLRAEYGRIINVSSIWGITGGSMETAYSAAKGGLIAFSKALAKETGTWGITVNAVAPGAVDTDMLNNLTVEDKQNLEDHTPIGRLGRPEDIAHAVLFLADPASSYITGQVISPNGGFMM